MRYFGLSKVLLNACKYMGKTGRFFAYNIKYYQTRHKFPNLIKPKDLSENILSTMLTKDYWDYSYYADKVAVREYIKSKGLGDLLLDVYGVWDNADEIDFEKLPEKFALKPNNGSGGHFICYDKAQIKDIEGLRKKMNHALILGENYKWEPHYYKIPPKLYAEELIETKSHVAPVDYKFMCINGKIGECLIILERTEDSHKVIRVDENGKILPYTIEKYLSSKKNFEKPKHWEEMVSIAKLLSEDFKCVRVDLYEYKDKVYFGELTFTPAGGILFTNNYYSLVQEGKLFNS